MRLLVTGGAGYIGSVVAARLLQEGHHVTVLDDLSKGHRDAVPPGARFIEGRIHDAARVINGAGFEAVIHRAAFSLVGESVEHPARYEENNVLGTARLCNAMQTLGVNKIIVSSTAAVYGEPDVAIIAEETKTAPVNPYGSSKLAIDKTLREEHTRANLLQSASVTSTLQVPTAPTENDTGTKHTSSRPPSRWPWANERRSQSLVLTFPLRTAPAYATTSMSSISRMFTYLRWQL